MILFVLLGSIIGSCTSSVWNIGGHDGGLTLGEISLHGHGHGHGLPAIDLGHSDHSISGWSGHGHGEVIIEEDHIGGGFENHGIKVIPIVKEIGIPVLKKTEFKVPELKVESVPQPYPVIVPVSKPVPYEVVKHVIKHVEKKVPTPVEKHIPVKVEKPVPYKVYKYIPVHVEKPVPFKVPVYKTIIHKSKYKK